MYSLPFFGVTSGGKSSSMPSLYEYLNNFTSIAIAPQNISQSIISATNVDFVYTLTRNNPRNITTTVNYVVSPDVTFPASATDFVDNAFPSGTLIFLPEETTKTITVSLKGQSNSLNKNFMLSFNAQDSDSGLVATPSTATGNGRGSTTTYIRGLNASLWLDAADTSTLTVTNSFVSEWRDKSGNSRHASQGTSSLQPIKPAEESAISFIGNKSFNVPGLSTATGNQNLFIVHSYTGKQSLIFTDAGLTVFSYVMQESSAGLSSGFGSPTYYREDVLQSWATRNDARNALLNRTSIVGAINCTLSSFNRISGYPSWEFIDKIYEIILIPGTISTTDRNLINGYLAWKWGLVASLPSNHPYKNTAPF